MVQSAVPSHRTAGARLGARAGRRGSAAGEGPGDSRQPSKDPGSRNFTTGRGTSRSARGNLSCRSSSVTMRNYRDRLLAPLYIPDLTRHASRKRPLPNRWRSAPSTWSPGMNGTAAGSSPRELLHPRVYRLPNSNRTPANHAEMVERVITRSGSIWRSRSSRDQRSPRERNEALTPFSPRSSPSHRAYRRRHRQYRHRPRSGGENGSWWKTATAHRRPRTRSG